MMKKYANKLIKMQGQSRMLDLFQDLSNLRPQMSSPK